MPPLPDPDPENRNASGQGHTAGCFNRSEASREFTSLRAKSWRGIQVIQCVHQQPKPFVSFILSAASAIIANKYHRLLCKALFNAALFFYDFSSHTRLGEGIHDVHIRDAFGHRNKLVVPRLGCRKPPAHPAVEQKFTRTRQHPLVYLHEFLHIRKPSRP